MMLSQIEMAASFMFLQLVLVLGVTSAAANCMNSETGTDNSSYLEAQTTQTEDNDCGQTTHQHVCNCHFHFSGSPLNESEPGCTKNNQCEQHLSCIDGGCQDPCTELCGNNTVCSVSRHVPSCSCNKGFIGDPALGCHEPEKRFHFYINETLSWFDALVDCLAQGRELMTLDNQEDFDKVYSLIKTHGTEFDPNTPFWTSGVETDNEVYVWTSTGVPVNFTNWGSGDPSHYQHANGPERCVALWHQHDYKMADYNCREKCYYMCQDYV